MAVANLMASLLRNLLLELKRQGDWILGELAALDKTLQGQAGAEHFSIASLFEEGLLAADGLDQSGTPSGVRT
jgi:hypothetical protein